MKKQASRTVLAIFLCIIVFFVLRQVNDNSPFSIIRRNKLQDKSAPEMNSLVFRVNFLGFIPAGEARLEEGKEEYYGGRRVYHLSASAKPLDFLLKVFKASAKVDSYVDADKLYTLKFTQSLTLPNKPKEIKEVFYDQERNLMELKGVKRQILSRTQDPLSSIFYIRHQDFELGKAFDMNINTNQKNYQLYAKVVAREERTWGDDKIGVWVLDGIIRRRDKNPYHKSTMKIWVMDNPEKTPLLIKVVSSAGPITARLIEAE